MKTNADGTYFQEGDRVRIKRTGETGSVNAADGRVVYVLMDGTNEAKLFSAYVDEDAYIEIYRDGENYATARTWGEKKRRQPIARRSICERPKAITLQIKKWQGGKIIPALAGLPNLKERRLSTLY